MSTINVKLTVPVEHDGKTISELTFREAEIGDLIAAANCETELERMVSVLASISNTPVAAFRRIKARDLKKIMAAVSDIVGNEISATIG